MHHPVQVFVKLSVITIMITTSDGAALNQNGTKNDSAVINIFSKTDKDQTKENTDLYFKEEGRKKEEGMMNRILPFMVIPFMVSTAMIPMMLISLKIMLLKSAFIGKLAVLLLILNLFRSRSSGQGGVFTHNVNERDMSMAHYGYSGDEEYGAYINRRKRNLR